MDDWNQLSVLLSWLSSRQKPWLHIRIVRAFCAAKWWHGDDRVFKAVIHQSAAVTLIPIRGNFAAAVTFSSCRVWRGQLWCHLQTVSCRHVVMSSCRHKAQHDNYTDTATCPLCHLFYYIISTWIDSVTAPWPAVEEKWFLIFWLINTALILMHFRWESTLKVASFKFYAAEQGRGQCHWSSSTQP